MSVVLAALGVLVAGAAVAALAARSVRVAAVALGVALGAAPFVADPLPGPTALALRVVAATLATWVLAAAARRAGTSGSTPAAVGLPGLALLAAAAFAAGWTVAGGMADLLAGATDETGLGTTVRAGLAEGSPATRAAIGAAIALATLGLVPLAMARDAVRFAVGLLLLATAAGLVRDAVLPADHVVSLGLAVVVAGLGAGGAALSARALGLGEDAEVPEVAGTPRAPRRAVEDAHPGDTPAAVPAPARRAAPVPAAPAASGPAAAPAGRRRRRGLPRPPGADLGLLPDDGAGDGPGAPDPAPEERA